MKAAKVTPDLARQVLPHLDPFGDRWKVGGVAGEESWNDWTNLEHRDGYGVELMKSVRRGNGTRIVISGVLPHKADGSRPSFYELGLPHFEITVALSRGPAIIAREIDRRFLPFWLPTWQKAVEILRDRQTFADGREAARSTLEASGLVRLWGNHAPFTLRAVPPHLNASAEVHSGDGIDVKIRARSAADAVRILQTAAGPDPLRDVARELLAWADMMGGWEASCWDRLRELLGDDGGIELESPFGAEAAA